MRGPNIFFAVAFLFFAGTAFAQNQNIDDRNEKRFDLSCSIGFSSRYHGEILAFPYTIKDAEFHIQPACRGTHNKSGLFAGLWATTTPNGETDTGDEVDYTFGIARSTKHFDWQVDLSVYDLRALANRDKIYSVRFLIASTRDGIRPFAKFQSFGTVSAYVGGLRYNWSSFWGSVEFGGNEGFFLFDESLPSFTRVKMGTTISWLGNARVTGAYQWAYQEALGQKAFGEGFWLEVRWNLF